MNMLFCKKALFNESSDFCGGETQSKKEEKICKAALALGMLKGFTYFDQWKDTATDAKVKICVSDLAEIAFDYGASVRAALTRRKSTYPFDFFEYLREALALSQEG